MDRPARSAGAMIVAVAVLLAGSGVVEAQATPDRRARDRFIRTKHHVLNRRLIARIDFMGGSPARAMVYFTGDDHTVALFGEEAEQLRAAFEEPAPRPAGNVGEAKGSRLVAFDDFDGKLALNWKPVRPDPSHVSLEKNPGKLTITTQRGSIHGETAKDEDGADISAKNLYLIDNPLAGDADFVVTTCISGIKPVTPYQQAGLIVYDDDDNYLKLDYEFDWRRGEGQTFICVVEANASPEHHPIEGSEQGLERFWLRLTKRGKVYEFATSVDGKDFRAHGTAEWGDGAPKRMGILAKNGGIKDVPEIDAAFEFFELRSPVAPAREEPKPEE